MKTTAGTQEGRAVNNMRYLLLCLLAIAMPAGAATNANSDKHFNVASFQLVGGQGVDLGALKDFVSSQPVGNKTLADIQALAQQCTAQLRAQDYALARVIVPAQTLSDGVVRLQVLPGNLESYRVNNKSGVSDSRFLGLLNAHLEMGAPLKSSDLEQTLLLASDFAGTGEVDSTLSPGSAIGTSQLSLDVAAGNKVDSSLVFDNNGNRYTGENRAIASASLNDVSGIGDRFQANIVATNQDLYFGSLSYDAPLSLSGLHGGLEASRNTYQLGQDFANLDAHGQSTIVSVYLRYPLVRRLDRNLAITATASHHALEDRIDAVSTLTDKTDKVFSLRFEGDRTDGFASGGRNRFWLTGTAGKLSFNNASAALQDAAGPRTQGNYMKWLLGVSRVQRLGSPHWQVRLQAQHQWANNNLDASEKFVLGGVGAVRAYPTGEGVVDEATSTTLALQYVANERFSTSLFYDWAGGKLNHTDYQTGTNTLVLAGYGLSFAYSGDHFVANLTLAQRDRSAPITAPDKQPRIRLQLGWRL